MGLTAKQEQFCLAYLETGNASEAYRRAYSAENMKPESINRKAKEMLDHGKITARLAELREPFEKRHRATLDDILRELEEARQIAIEDRVPAAAISAAMGKAKLLGHDRTDADLDREAKRLQIEKLRRELEDPNKGLPEPKQVIIGVEDASLADAE